MARFFDNEKTSDENKEWCIEENIKFVGLAVPCNYERVKKQQK
ncbi:MAG: hypothetical protein ACLTKE_07485 [Coprococcus sp.]